jgi:hypothetical protein
MTAGLYCKIRPMIKTCTLYSLMTQNDPNENEFFEILKKFSTSGTFTPRPQAQKKGARRLPKLGWKKCV